MNFLYCINDASLFSKELGETVSLAPQADSLSESCALGLWE